MRVTSLPLTRECAKRLLRRLGVTPCKLRDVYSQVSAFKVPDYCRELALANLHAAAIDLFGSPVASPDVTVASVDPDRATALVLAQALGLRSSAGYLVWRRANMRAALALESALSQGNSRL